ncbi:MAG: hypothetical protein ACI4CC_01605 [Lachnospiraceae bacterium]
MTEIEIKQNNGNLINIRADSEDSGLFYDGLFKMLSQPVKDFRDERNAVDVEPKKPELEPVETKEPEPEPVETKEPESKPVETKEPEPIETKEPESKPVEAKEPKPIEAKEPEPKPVKAKEPEPKPVKAKEPEPKPVEAKEPGPKPKAAEPQEPQNDGLPDIPEGVDPLEPPAEEIAKWSVSDFTERMRSMSDDVYDIAGDPARRELKKRIENILRTKYNVRSLPSVPKDKWSRAYADVKRTYLILKEELISQNAAD